MRQLERFREIVKTYRKHEWRVARVLMTGETLAQLRGEAGAGENEAPRLENVAAQHATFDALWFTRASGAGREAWELRLVAETPYALFELFEPDEAEEERADVRREMEARMREYAGVDEGATQTGTDIG